jgi:hypothetical protein
MIPNRHRCWRFERELRIPIRHHFRYRCRWSVSQRELMDPSYRSTVESDLEETSPIRRHRRSFEKGDRFDSNRNLAQGSGVKYRDFPSHLLVSFVDYFCEEDDLPLVSATKPGVDSAQSAPCQKRHVWTYPSRPNLEFLPACPNHHLLLLRRHHLGRLDQQSSL